MVTEENIKKIESAYERLIKWDIDISYDDINIGDKVIEVSFPHNEESTIYNVSDFLLYVDDLETIKKVGQSTVRSSLSRQSLIDIDEFTFDKLNMDQNVIVKEGDYRIRLVKNPFLIGYINSIEGNYNKRYGLWPCSLYVAIEIVYENSYVLLPEDEENELLKSALFYWSTKYSKSLTFGTMLTLEDCEDYEDMDEDDNENSNISWTNIKEILPYSPLMDMYVEAMGIKVSKIRFLYFYKIIEYISPIVAKRKSYELLSQKLDLPYCDKQSWKY